MQKKILWCALATCSFTFSSQQPTHASDSKKTAEKTDWYAIATEIAESAPCRLGYDKTTTIYTLLYTMQRTLIPALLERADCAHEEQRKQTELLKQQVAGQAKQTAAIEKLSSLWEKFLSNEDASNQSLPSASTTTHSTPASPTPAAAKK